MVERWGKAVLQRFKKLKAEKDLDGDAESQASTEEWILASLRGQIEGLAPFPLHNMDLNLARWDQWMRRHLGTKVLWKAGGDPLVAWACRVCRLRGQWGTREEECRSVLDKAEDQNAAEASRVFPDAVASPGLKGEREDGLAQDLGLGDGEPLTAGQRMVVEDVRQETALDVDDGEGNVLREEESQGRGSPPRMAASSESAEQQEEQGSNECNSAGQAPELVEGGTWMDLRGARPDDEFFQGPRATRARMEREDAAPADS